MALFGLLLACVGCGGGTPPQPPQGHKNALVIGTASGAVRDLINKEYGIHTGTGGKDPSDYSMLVFDGNTTTPQEIHDNPATAAFWRAGKPVVILHNTKADRRDGLKGLVWAYSEGASPAVAYFKRRDPNGPTAQVVEVDFPASAKLKVNPSNTAGAPEFKLSGISYDENPATAKKWLTQLQAKLAERTRSQSAQDGGSGFPAPTVSAGQTVASFNVIQPYNLTQTSAEGFSPMCKTGTENIGQSQSMNASWEVTGTALLVPEGNDSYHHEVIVRQQLIFSPEFTKTQVQNVCGWEENLYDVLGFSAQFLLTNDLEAPASGPQLVMTSFAPQAANNTTTLSTSQTHNQQVGVSATIGASVSVLGPGISGSVSDSYSAAWGWTAGSTINISDWSSASNSSSGGATLATTYQATGGSNFTYDFLTGQYGVGSPGNINHDCGSQEHDAMNISPSDLNALQTSAMTTSNETVWDTPTGQTFPPGTVTLQVSMEPDPGEWFDWLPGAFYHFTPGFVCPGIPPNVYSAVGLQGYLHSWVASKDIKLDFSNAGLQPPQQAPWTLQFSTPASSSGYYQTTGTLTLNSAAPSGGTRVAISYVLQPQNPLLTEGDICPANSGSFQPSPSVISGSTPGSKPSLAVTVPAGQTSVTFPVSFQAVGQTYNVQVVSWQPGTTINDQTVINPQDAYCLTIPAGSG